MRLKSEPLRVNDRSPLFTVIIDTLVCTSSLGSVDRVARLNGTFPTIGDLHIVTNIRIFPMITDSAVGALPYYVFHEIVSLCHGLIRKGDAQPW